VFTPHAIKMCGSRGGKVSGSAAMSMKKSGGDTVVANPKITLPLENETQS
jgi:hypothetical protein